MIIAIGFVLKYLQTNGLTPEDFGNYTFISSFVSFSILFFQFGFIPSIQLLLAKSDKKKNDRKIIGLGFILTLILGSLFSLFIFIFSYLVDDIFETNVSDILLISSPLFFSFLFIQLFSAIGTGSGKPSIGVYFELISRILFMIILFVLYQMNLMSVLRIIVFSTLSHIFTIVTFFFLLKPAFTDLKNTWQTLKNTNATFGKDYYFGSITNQSTFKLDDLMIAAWINPIQLGFYSIARLLCSPIGLGSSAINNAMFKNYSKLERIPQRIFLLITTLSILGVIIINIAGDFIIVHFFGKEYIDASSYILIFSLAFFFMAMYQPFNFLTAKGKGKVVRNTAIVESLINILGNIILIPLLGIAGALYTTLVARMSHFFMKWYYYTKYLHQIAKDNG